MLPPPTPTGISASFQSATPGRPVDPAGGARPRRITIEACHNFLPANRCSSMPTTRCGKTIFISNAPSRHLSVISTTIKYSPAEVRRALNAVERETILAHGYGLSSFAHSLLTCFERLSPAPVTVEKTQRILSFAHSIAEQEIELLPGVAETLAEIAVRHRLILMTKGNHAEQADKLARSGLARILFRSRNRGGKRPSHLSTGDGAA